MIEQLTSPSAETIVVLVLVLVAIWIIATVWSRGERFISGIVHQKRTDDRRDSVRTFTKKQREEGMSRCNNRCEGTGLMFRCRYRGDDLHGDHWYPHSRGGSTSVKNLVMLCPNCNLRKSAKIPSLAQTGALRFRRALGIDYTDTTTEVGEWLPRSYQREITSRAPRPSSSQQLWDF